MTHAPRTTDPHSPDAWSAAWDRLTPELMRRRGSAKWDVPGDVIGAWVAEMDLGVAPAIAQVVRRAVDDGSLGYMPPSLGLAAREATVRYVAEELGWRVPIEDLTLAPNVLGALRGVIEHHTAPGSAVIVPTPAYMPFLTIPGEMGRECLQVPALRTCPAPGGAAPHIPGRAPWWSLDLEGIEAAMASGAGLLVLCNPWNPVGRVLGADELDAVAALSARYRVPVFADEIHAPLVVAPGAAHLPYGSRPGADPDLTFTALAASKGWNVPGLMCAQLVASGRARRAWQETPATAVLGHGAAPLGAAAAVAAYDSSRDWNLAARRYIAGNVERAVDALAHVEGVEMTVPAGTYLAWLDCSDLPLPQEVGPADWFAREPGVVMNDGAAFGRGYESFCRLNLATGRGVLDQVLDRLADAVARL